MSHASIIFDLFHTERVVTGIANDILVLLDETTDKNETEEIQILSEITSYLYARRTNKLQVVYDHEVIQCAYCGVSKPRCDFMQVSDIKGIGHTYFQLNGYFCEECLPKAVPTYSHYCEVCGKHFWWRRGGLCEECKSESNIAEYKRVKSQNWRTKKLGLRSDLKTAEWLEILKQYDYKCAYCGEDYQVLDHVIPVNKGGGTTKNNVVPSCIRCNSRKHDQLGWQSQLEVIYESA